MLLAPSFVLLLTGGLAFAPPADSFEALVARYAAAEGVETRVGLLDAIAQAGRGEELADGVVVRALSDGLEDESYDVRGRAAELIAGFDARFALRELRSAVKNLNDSYEELLEKLDEAAADQPKRGKPRKIGEDMTAEIGALGRLVRAQNEARDPLENLHVLRCRYAGALGTIDDKQSVRLLRDLSEPLPPSALQDEIAAAWLTLGTRSALTELMDLFERHEADIKARTKALEVAEVDPNPRINTLSDALRGRQRDQLVAELNKRLAWGADLAARLKAFAEIRALSKMPPSAAIPARSWADWLRSVRSELR